MTAVERLDAIEARAKGLPAGPWRVESDDADSGHDVWSDRGDWTKEISLANVDNADFTGDGDDQRIAVFIADARTDVPALTTALRAVLVLHKPWWSSDRNGYECAHCGAYLTDAAPDCPTVRVITAALDLS